MNSQPMVVSKMTEVTKRMRCAARRQRRIRKSAFGAAAMCCPPLPAERCDTA